MSKKLRRLQALINLVQVVAVAAIAISILLIIIFSGEPTSNEGTRIQFICLFSFAGVMVMSFVFALCLEKFKSSHFFKGIERSDYRRRAAKLEASAQTQKDLQECLISIGKANPNSLNSIETNLLNDLRDLRCDYFTFSQKK